MNSKFRNSMRIYILTTLIFSLSLLVFGIFGCSQSNDKGLSGIDLPLVQEAQTNQLIQDNTQTLERYTKFFDWKPSGNPKHVILIIGDGMQLEHEIATSRYLYGTDRGLSFHSFPYKGHMTTWDTTTYDRWAWELGYGPYDPMSFIPAIGYNVYRGGYAGYPDCPVVDDDYFLTRLPKWGGGSVSYPATDSASSATAMSTGYKTEDGNIAWLPGDPPDGALETIHETARHKLDMAMGIVSTVPFSHATPAAFVSHNVSRNNYHEIAKEIIFDVMPDVVIGGGHPNWRSGFISDEDYYGLYDHSDYLFVERKPGVHGGRSVRLASLRAMFMRKKLFGLYGGTGGNFEPPIPANGYVGFTIERENPTLSDATIAALNVLGTNKNGFVLMVEQGDIDWANHANDYAWMIGTTYDLHKTVESVVNWVNRPFNGADWSNTLVIVTSDHANSYMRNQMVLGKGELPLQVPKGNSYEYPNGEVTYGSGSHTNEPVSVYAIGAGARLFKQYENVWYRGSNLVDNTHIYHVIADFLNL